jgi:hypothetical protein
MSNKTVVLALMFTAAIYGQVVEGKWCKAPCTGVVDGQFTYPATERDAAKKNARRVKKQSAAVLETPAPIVPIPMSTTDSSYNFAESIRHFMYANPKLVAFLLWVANVCKVLLITAVLLICLYIAIKSMTFAGGTPFVSPVAKCPACGHSKSDEAGPCFHAFHERAQVFSNVIRELGGIKQHAQ